MPTFPRVASWSPSPVPDRMRAGSIASIPPPRVQSGGEDDHDAMERVSWRGLMRGAMTRVNMPPKPVFAVHDEARMQASWDSARATRLLHLNHLDDAPSAPLHTPKDLTVRPRYMYLRCTSEEGATYCNQFTRIGMLEGYRTVVEGHELRSLGVSNTLFNAMARVKTYTHEDDGEWAEDDGSFACDGSVSVPANIDDAAFTRRSLVEGRVQRMPRHSAAYSYSGTVDEEDRQRFKVALAVRMNRPLRVNFSHIEGGNILVGIRPDRTPYAVVGRDSVELTRRLIERDRGLACTTREALVAIAKDYGVPTSQVFPVEQPRCFHLDLSVALMAEGQVLLQDSMLTAEKQLRWRAEEAITQEPAPLGLDATDAQRTCYRRAYAKWWKKRTNNDQAAREIVRLARLRAPYEERALRDLRAAGLQVHRVAGRYMGDLRSTNFLNGEGGINLRGERYYITQSGDARAQAYFANLLLRVIPTGLRRIYFIDAHASAESLLDWGGAACRAKVEGDVVWPAAGQIVAA